MSITVAIPNYNGKAYLEKLLPELAKQGFSHIIVLDDASTDSSVEWLKDQVGVEVIAGKTNLGPTGNRNRILDTKTGDIILFLDVDIELTTPNTSLLLETEFSNHPKAAVIGPLIMSDTDEPMWYNWGYESSPKLDGAAEVLNGMALAHWGEPTVMATIRELAKGKVGHLEPVRSRTVDWIVEQFFAVRSDVFRNLGGFDPKFRMFHEGPDYCLRARQMGHLIRFTTAITAKHLDQHSGSSKQRAADMRASTKYYYKKHYNIEDDVIDRFFLS